MVFVDVKIRTRNRFTIRLKAIAEGFRSDKVEIATKGVTKQKGENRYVLSSRRHGKLVGKNFRLELLLIYEDITAGATISPDGWSATFRDSFHLERGFEQEPNIERMDWSFFTETIEVDEIMDDKWGFITPTGGLWHVPL